ncbi:hypothetical protein KGM_203648 [Danaus plexippus plexippus]|uniref:Uncharacterized protein n=1 Tax=Danaus plexippus plexippus TaxID=278856 RepID=A0A212EIP3_DANPL|nr:hypothetical protein KGM_203648 [Danaus plexippus plexippus]
MSTLVLSTVGIVVAIISHSIGLQLKNNFNDAINWFINPDIDRNLNNNNKMHHRYTYDKRSQNFPIKHEKLHEYTDKNILSYNNEIQLNGEDNRNYDAQNDAIQANSLEVPNKYISVKSTLLNYPPMKRKPNYLLKRGNGANNLYKDVSNNDLTDYSKIYLVLDPDANLGKTDVRDISKLLSSMLTKFNINNNPPTMDSLKRPRYKGFLLGDNRRRIRESNESKKSNSLSNQFIPKDSLEHEHKPKRSRSEYSGARGRTGIPYVRHRGDVYERE